MVAHAVALLVERGQKVLGSHVTATRRRTEPARCRRHVLGPATPEEAPHPLDIRSLPLAFHLPYTQTWKLEGYTRGRMVNSFALAPGEEQTVVA